MDWKKITDTMTPYIAKMDPYLDKAKEYGKKATVFAEEQIQSTPLFIRSQAEYDAILAEKRVIVIAYDEADPIAQDIRILSPIWLTRAFMDTARLRYISTTESSDLIHNIGLNSPLDMRVRYEGVETHQFTNITDIKNWWQSPIYKKSEPVESIIIDPLAGK